MFCKLEYTLVSRRTNLKTLTESTILNSEVTVAFTTSLFFLWSVFAVELYRAQTQKEDGQEVDWIVIQSRFLHPAFYPFYLLEVLLALLSLNTNNIIDLYRRAASTLKLTRADSEHLKLNSTSVKLTRRGIMLDIVISLFRSLEDRVAKNKQIKN